MFTGIVEGTGKVVASQAVEGGSRLTLETPSFDGGLRLGDSLAVNGVCLTVAALDGVQVSFDAVPETLRRTNLGDLAAGDRVNLERPLRVDSRLDGHLVQGHVDATATVEAVVPEGAGYRIRFQLSPEWLRFLIEKGSVAVDGISLTVAALREDGFEVIVIPHTWEVTNLGARQPGQRVNIEVDMLAKYVERLLVARLA